MLCNGSHSIPGSVIFNVGIFILCGPYYYSILTNSYIHLPGIGATTERKIWNCGIKWDEFREEPHRAGLPESKLKQILEGISTSKEKLNARDHTYFANNLPKKEHWRAYRKFRDDTIFLDIETTGLSPIMMRSI